VYSSLHFIKCVILDSKSYTKILQNKRIVSLESNSGMRYRELGSSKGYDKEKKRGVDDKTKDDKSDDEDKTTSKDDKSHDEDKTNDDKSHDEDKTNDEVSRIMS
jgi:hypothetical protein